MSHYDDWSFDSHVQESKRHNWLHADLLTAFLSKDISSIWRRHTPCPSCVAARRGSTQLQCGFGNNCAFAKRPVAANQFFGESMNTLSAAIFHSQNEVFWYKRLNNTTQNPKEEEEEEELEKTQESNPIPCELPVDPMMEKSLPDYLREHKFHLRLHIAEKLHFAKPSGQRPPFIALVNKFQEPVVLRYFDYHLKRLGDDSVTGVQYRPIFPLRQGNTSRFKCYNQKCGSVNLWGRVSVFGRNHQLRPPLGTFVCRDCGSCTYLCMYESVKCGK